MKGEIVHIISDYRSGSTLLDQLLGVHPEICGIGEVRHIKAYALRDRSLHNPTYSLDCSCGKPLGRCPFWSSVEDRLGRPLAQLNLDRLLVPPAVDDSASNWRFRSKLGSLARGLFWSPLRPLAGALLMPPRHIKDNYDLYRAIECETRGRFIIDSSKSAIRCAALFAAKPESNRVILLCRDYRGVIHSKMARGRDMLKSAQTWANTVENMEHLASSLPVDRVHRMRYEDLCAEPATEMRRVCGFLSIEFMARMTTRRASQNHQIGGSPSKHENHRKDITLDSRYKDAFSTDDLQSIRAIVGDAARKWHYD